MPTGEQWRPNGLVYKHNNIYIDVVEKLSACFSASGNVLKADVNGVIQIKSTLSGMPTCKIGNFFIMKPLTTKSQ